MVSQPETMMTIGNNEETRVPITLAQKNELDRIMTTRPHVFPNKMVVYWRLNLADITPSLTKSKTERFGLPIEFRLMVYDHTNCDSTNIISSWVEKKKCLTGTGAITSIQNNLFVTENP